MLTKIPRTQIHLSCDEIFAAFNLAIHHKFKEGKEIEKFEEKFSEYLKCKHAVCTFSGKQALYIILKSLNFRKGDEILIPSYTASSVPMTVIYAGLKPVFVDVDQETFNINPNLIESEINRKTKAVIATHIHGLPCNIETISKICNKHNLILIEDCAHGLDAEYKGKKVGTFGKVSFFSFGPGKHLSTLGGGMIVSNDDELIRRIENSLMKYEFPSNFELFCKLVKMIFLSIFTQPIIFTLFIYPFLYLFGNDLITTLFETKVDSRNKMPSEYTKRFSNMQALIGMHELKLLENNMSKRIKNALILKEQLKNLKGIRIQEYPKFLKHAYLDFAVSVKDREKTIKKLLNHGIDVQKTWLDDCSGLSPFREYEKDCPNSKMLAKSILYLPIYPSLKERDIMLIARVFKNCAK
jgi:dTDP-4-amino-4,6-dideoxygalactose transaminase